MSKAPRIAYLIPEFPGQTHIWIWREITHLREWAVEVDLFSTRRPADAELARHAFASEAARSTCYLAPISVGRAVGAVLWLLSRPVRALSCARMALRLPVDRSGRKRPAPIKLLLPAAILAREVERRGVDHLHAHTAASGAILCMMVKRLTGIDFGISLNAPLGWWGGAMSEKLDAARFTLVITDNLMREVLETLPELPAEKFRIGRVGVDTRRHVPGAPRDGTERIVLTAGRLHPSKGHDDLIRAAALLRDRGRPITLRLAGAGSHEAELRALASSLGLAERVEFLGSLGEEALIAAYQSADAFVLASHAEPMGVVYMEAMSCGLPTIGTAAGGVGEIIRHEVDGLLVPPRDPQTLATAIDRVLTDQALRSALSEQGRQRIIDVFDSRHGAAVLYRAAFGAEPPTPPRRDLK